ncbi:MAG: hypothetical protein ACREFP_21480 [Acetobacteraceae bacterium]
MRRIILRMIATNALSAFSVPTGAVGVARPIIPARAGEAARQGASAAPSATLPKLPSAPPSGGKILPRGSLLDLSV